MVPRRRLLAALLLLGLKGLALGVRLGRERRPRALAASRAVGTRRAAAAAGVHRVHGVLVRVRVRVRVGVGARVRVRVRVKVRVRVRVTHEDAGREFIATMSW